jgi:tRNA threonylcarbamoyladenosine biosynthesis protein TsaB
LNLYEVNLLAIETSGEFCSLALARGETVFARHFPAGKRQAELALDTLEDLLREAQLALDVLEGIAYGEGPGAFTGLRVACGLTQGLALARSLPVVGVGTLEALAEESGEGKVVACLDARMGEVYHAAYVRENGRWTQDCAPGLYGPGEVPALQGKGWTGCGSGFAAYGEALCARYAGQIDKTLPLISPTAQALLRLARPRFERREVRDAASAVPVYLRDKVALRTSERR